MTDERLAELERLANAATPGPWHSRDSRRHPENWTVRATGETNWPEGGCSWDVLACIRPEDDPEDYGFVVIFGEADDGEVQPKSTDLDFIAAARLAVPELIAEIRRLRGAA